MRIGVIGGGFAGAAAALALAKAGHQVELFEAVDEPSPVGAGILLQPTGQLVLKKLGLWEPVRERGVEVHDLACFRRAHGHDKAVFHLPYAAASEDCGLGLHRGVLFNVLFHALRPAGVRVHLGIEAQAGEGGTICTGAGPIAHFDLVVVADGARSQSRTAFFPFARDTAYPYGALWFVTEDREQLFPHTLHQQLYGTHEMIGFLPTGFGPEGDEPLVSFFYSVRAKDVPAIRRRGLPTLREHILGLAPHAAQLLERIPSMDALLFAEYRDVVVPHDYKDRTVFIGDAAHAMSPQLGQGSNLALLDAWALAETLKSASLHEAMANYSRLRRHNHRFYQFASRWLTPFFQSDLQALGMLRDVAFPLATRIPYLRKRMVRVMCGAERGFLRRPLD